MHYLIDGHNLIAHMPNIDLSDADDEAQLVLRLRRWAAAGRKRKRRITLFFDGGLPGGYAPEFSGGSLKVIFASVGREADTLLIRRIGKVRNPPEFTLVTSDRAILAVAEGRGMPTLSSQTFAAMLHAEGKKGGPADRVVPDKEDPSLDERDVARWLDIFDNKDE